MWLTVAASLQIPTQAHAAEGKAPVIVSMGSGAGGEITISAEINPEGLETSYELKLECGTGEPMACNELPSERTQGKLPPGNEAREVHMTVTGLKPGKYWFGVSASNAAGEVFRSSNILTVPEVPPGACPSGCSSNEQYGSEIPGWYEKLSEEESAQTRKEYEIRHAKELEAQHLKEQEEQRNREAAAAAEAAALKRRQEEEAQQGRGGGAMLAGTNITVERGGVSFVDLECYGASTCSGRLVITARVSTVAKSGRRNVKKMVIGSTGFSVPGDTEKTVKVRMNRIGRGLLGAANRRIGANLEIDERLPSAKWTRTQKAVHLIWQASRR